MAFSALRAVTSPGLAPRSPYRNSQPKSSSCWQTARFLWNAHPNLLEGPALTTSHESTRDPRCTVVASGVIMALRTALLVVDMQVFFETMTAMAMPNIQKLITYFQSKSAPVVLTQHGHSDEELSTTPSPSQLVRRWGPAGSIRCGSEDWQLQDAIKQYLPGTGGSKQWPRIVDKNTYDAFINSSLEHKAGLVGFGNGFGEVMLTSKVLELLEGGK